MDAEFGFGLFIGALLMVLVFVILNETFLVPQEFQKGFESAEACREVNSRYKAKTRDNKIVVCENGQLARIGGEKENK